MRYTVDNMLIKTQTDGEDPDLILAVSPQSAGWEDISFQARRLEVGGNWSFDTGENEFALVNLSGRYRVESNRGSWAGSAGGRMFSVGAPMPSICRGALV